MKKLKLNEFDLTDLTIELNSGCNLNCNFCPRSEFRGTENIKMSTKILRKIIHELESNEDFKYINLTFSSYNEPLYNDSFFDKLRFIRKRLSNTVGFKFYTNSTLLTYEKLNALFNKDINVNLLFADCYSKKELDYLLGYKNDSIKILKFNFPDKFYNNKFDIFYDNVMSKNIFNYKAECYNNIFVLIYRLSDNVFSNKIRYWKRYSKNIEYNNYSFKILKNSSLCGKLYSSLIIDYKGDYIVCCNYTDNSKFNLGNVMNKSIYDVWNSDQLIMYRNKLYEFNLKRIKYNKRIISYDEIPEPCKYCSLLFENIF